MECLKRVSFPRVSVLIIRYNQITSLPYTHNCSIRLSRNLPATSGTWSQPTRRPKRKRADDVDGDLDNFDFDFVVDKQNATKKSIQPPKKKQTKTSSRPTAKTTSKSTAKDTSKLIVEALRVVGVEKLYWDTLEAMKKDVDALNKVVENMSCNHEEVTTDDYAATVSKYLPAVQKLKSVNRNLALDLLLKMADRSHTDLDLASHMCGFGDSEPHFRALDQALLPLIAKNTVPPYWRDWNFRIEEIEKWVQIVLAGFKKTRDYLDQYGVEGYFPLSIARLEKFVSM